jgi:hypothetical protein
MLLLLLRLNEDLVESGDKESGEFCELSDEPIDDFTIPQNNKTMCPTLFLMMFSRSRKNLIYLLKIITLAV